MELMIGPARLDSRPFASIRGSISEPLQKEKTISPALGPRPHFSTTHFFGWQDSPLSASSTRLFVEAVPPKVRIGSARSAPASSDRAEPREHCIITAPSIVCAAVPGTSADVLRFGFARLPGETGPVRNRNQHARPSRPPSA